MGAGGGTLHWRSEGPCVVTAAPAACGDPGLHGSV